MTDFSSKSLLKLSDAAGPIKLVSLEVVKIFDHGVIEAHRDADLQNKYYREGVSKVQYPNSKHNKYPSHAIDVWVYSPIHKMYFTGSPENIKELSGRTGLSYDRCNNYIRTQYAILASLYIGIAHANGFKFTWGGDWDGDFDLLDQKFNDLYHIQYDGDLK